MSKRNNLVHIHVAIISCYAYEFTNRRFDLIFICRIRATIAPSKPLRFLPAFVRLLCSINCKQSQILCTRNKCPAQSTKSIVHAVFVQNFLTLINRLLSRLMHQSNAQCTIWMVLLFRLHIAYKWQIQHHMTLMNSSEEKKTNKNK